MGNSGFPKALQRRNNLYMVNFNTMVYFSCTLVTLLAYSILYITFSKKDFCRLSGVERFHFKIVFKLIPTWSISGNETLTTSPFFFIVPDIGKGKPGKKITSINPILIRWFTKRMNHSAQIVSVFHNGFKT